MPITNSAPPERKPAATAAQKRTSRLTQDRADALNGLGALAQVPLIATRQYADAAAIGTHWPNVAGELAKLADQEEVVAKFIDPLIKVGPYTGIITAVLPLVLQLMVNHKLTSPGMMGTVPPEALSAQMEAGIASAQLEALKEQRAAEEATRQLRASMARERDEFEMASRKYVDEQLDADLR